MSWQPGRESGPLGPYRKAKAVTPSNSIDLPDGVCQALYCSGAGDINMDLIDGDTVVIAMTAGWVNVAHFLAKRIRAASTTATGIVALYI